MSDEREPSLLDRTRRSPPTALLVSVLLLLVSHALATLSGLREPTPSLAGIAVVAIVADAFLVRALVLGQVRLGAAAITFAIGIVAAGWAGSQGTGEQALVARAASAAAPALLLLASASWGWLGRRAIDSAQAPESLLRWLASARRDLVDAAVARLGGSFDAERTARALEPALAWGGRAGMAAVAATLELSHRSEGRAPAIRALASVAERGEPTVAWAAALALAEIDAHPELRSLLGQTRDPHRRAALIEALSETAGAEEETAAAGVTLLADPSVPPDARAHALSVIADERFLRHALAPLRDALSRTAEPTVEALAALEEAGTASDAPLAGRFVGSRAYPLSEAALFALEKIVERDPPRDLTRAATLAAIASARDWMRAVHPPGDNALADGLIVRIEKLEKTLA
jgi:hypothetical protein